MNTAPQTLANAINLATSKLASASLLKDYRHSIVSKGGKGTSIVSWDNSVAYAPARGERYSLGDYIHELKNRHYSLLFRDNSFVQVTYFFDGHAVVGHRLSYVPSPLQIDEAVWAEAGLEAALPNTQELPTAFWCRGPWRFDFDPQAEAPGHPASHLTVNHSSCRIPVAYPLALDRFLTFVVEHLHSPQSCPSLELSSLTTARVLPEPTFRGWFLDFRE